MRLQLYLQSDRLKVNTEGHTHTHTLTYYTLSFVKCLIFQLRFLKICHLLDRERLEDAVGFFFLENSSACPVNFTASKFTPEEFSFAVYIIFKLALLLFSVLIFFFAFVDHMFHDRF